MPVGQCAYRQPGCCSHAVDWPEDRKQEDANEQIKGDWHGDKSPYGIHLILIVPFVVIISLLLSIAYVSIDTNMQSSSKRTLQINVRMSPEEWDLLKRAADAIWPKAEITNASIMLGLAKMAAEDILKKKSGKKGS